MIEKALLYVYNIINIGIPKHFTDLTSKRENDNDISNGNKPFFNCRTESFKNSFFPYTTEALEITLKTALTHCALAVWM